LGGDGLNIRDGGSNLIEKLINAKRRQRRIAE
jgi:hypothetical protein